MKKVNIQNDLRSRAEISGRMENAPEVANSTERIDETVNEPLNESTDAQSEVVQEPAADESSAAEETPKKKGRKAKGDV